MGIDSGVSPGFPPGFPLGFAIKIPLGATFEIFSTNCSTFSFWDAPVDSSLDPEIPPGIYSRNRPEIFSFPPMRNPRIS